jgi:hypothetical protein
MAISEGQNVDPYPVQADLTKKPGSVWFRIQLKNSGNNLITLNKNIHIEMLR